MPSLIAWGHDCPDFPSAFKTFKVISAGLGATPAKIGRWRMRRIALLALALGSLVPFLASAPAHAQATRTWVSGVGDDANPCSRTAPCKTFAGSISKTAAGGEINCIDPGGFGALTITKSITIDCANTEAGVLVAGTNGITVNAAATDFVVLRGLDFDGTGTGLSGISILSAAKVNILKSAIRNFTAGGSGITLAPNNIATRLYVSDTFISNNGNSATTGGIVIRPVGTGTAAVVITNSKVDANTSGVRSDGTAVTTGTVKVTVVGSSISGNANDGATSIANTPGGSILMINKSVIAYNVFSGIIANNAIVQLGDSVVTGNATGLNSVNSAILASYKNSSINGNTTDITGTVSPLTLQ
jgi:hypothetical protein